ncbi:hypothetical protein DH2020_028046 [Rehmannia glutinosa]|uniref:Uncharacterized protein n=1 Tax=Rehmannia glutinosa TaxID=99300 RepID=A0ABR0VSI8_REHGL
MSRAMVLVFLLLILIITSQFEWRQQLVSDMDSNPTTLKSSRNFRKERKVSKRRYAYTKLTCTENWQPNVQSSFTAHNYLITGEEHPENEGAHSSLRDQLKQCWSNNETFNGTLTSLTDHIIQLEQLQIPED